MSHVHKQSREHVSCGEAKAAIGLLRWSRLRLASILSRNYFYGADRAGVGGDISGQGCDGLMNFAAFHDFEHALHRLQSSNASYFARVFDVINSARIALLRQRDGLDRKWARILLLVVTDDVGQLAFRDPRGIADLSHRNRLGESVLDDLDLGLVALDRNLVEFAVALDQQQAVAKRAQGVRVVQRP